MADADKEIAAELSEWMGKKFGWEKEKKNLWHDDWTLIVRLHAMIETALNGALINEIGKPELVEIIAKLDTSNQSTGKAAFAKALGILSRDSIVFLQKLSELRNACVHDVRNFEFDLIAHMNAIKPDKRKELTKAIGRIVEPGRISCLQEGLLVGTMDIMLQLMLHDSRCETRALSLELVRLQAESYRAQKESTPKE